MFKYLKIYLKGLAFLAILIGIAIGSFMGIEYLNYNPVECLIYFYSGITIIGLPFIFGMILED